MKNELTEYELDGFAGFNDEVEGDDRPVPSSVPLVQFYDPNQYVLRGTGEQLLSTRQFIAVDIVRMEVKWGAEGPPEKRVLLPREKFRNLDELNETVKEEWRPGPSGELQGPYRNQYEVILVDPETMDQYQFVTDTNGGHLAVGELVRKTLMRRALVKKPVHPVVTLTATLFSKRFRKNRPQFTIARWITLDGSDTALPAAPPAPALTGPPSVAAALDTFAATTVPEPAAEPVKTPAAEPAKKPAAKTAAATKPTALKAGGAQIVDEPTLSEEMKDEILF